MSIASMPVTVLKQVLTIREKIDQLEAELAKLVGTAPASASGNLLVSKASKSKPARKKRTMSASGRAAIAAAQKARWARIRAAKPKGKLK